MDDTSATTIYTFLMMSYSVSALTAQILCKDNPNLIPLYESVLDNTKQKLLDKAMSENKNLSETAMKDFTQMLEAINKSIRLEMGIVT